MIKIKLFTIAFLTSAVFLVITSGATLSPYSRLLNVNETTVVNSAPSIQMYFYIKKYADKYDIPEPYAFSLAYQETRYGGPLDMNYNHKQISYAGALGPMQIMPATAKMMYGRAIPHNRLKSDIELNVMISMKLLRHLYDTYGDWGLAFGAYNTGKPCINQYARNILNKEYTWER